MSNSPSAGCSPVFVAGNQRHADKRITTSRKGTHGTALGSCTWTCALIRTLEFAPTRRGKASSRDDRPLRSHSTPPSVPLCRAMSRICFNEALASIGGSDALMSWGLPLVGCFGSGATLVSRQCSGCTIHPFVVCPLVHSEPPDYSEEEWGGLGLLAMACGLTPGLNYRPIPYQGPG